MGFRFRRTLSCGQLVRLNFGKTGVSLSAGVQGAKMTFGRSGIRTTVGLPNTGLSYTHLERPKPAFWVPPMPSRPWPRWLRLALWIALVSLVLWVLK
jgi:hypothetical protein